MAGQVHAPAVTPFGCYNVTISNAAVTLQQLITAAGGGTINADAKHFDLLPESGDVRWTDDGTTPTAAVGFLAPQGAVYPVRNDRSRMLVHKFIRTGGSDVTASLWIAG